jgi:hypothetical protein
VWCTRAASAHTILSRIGVPIYQFNMKWQILPDRQRKEAVLIGALGTRHFYAGDYQVVQSVPLDAPSRRLLLASFTLLPNDR